MELALTIAGSDSGGGAGVQADLKTFHAHAVFGASVVTAVTAQNSVAVTDSFELPPSIITAQLDAVFDDFEFSATKTGMLASAAVVTLVADALRERKVDRLVVDPVMVSKSGYKLLAEDAVESLKAKLLPLATIVTPNVPEAELLAERSIESVDDMKAAAMRIREYGCKNVLVKGGHANSERATDILFDGRRFHSFDAEFIDTKNTHGTGCTFSAAITARLARGESLLDAVGQAKRYITQAIANALDIGSGHGPTNHFYFLGSDDSLT